MRGQDDVSGFIQSFTGSHRFVLDYLLEEVLHQQPDDVQAFFLKTAVLNQLTGSLCDVLTGEANSREILELLDRANLFLVPLDNERRWYRYHHLLQNCCDSDYRRVPQRVLSIRCTSGPAKWYEVNGFELEAFYHATAANDVDRALRSNRRDGLPLYFRARRFRYGTGWNRCRKANLRPGLPCG